MPKLVVYTSDTCPYCVMLKQFLDSRGVEYEERNVSRNRQYARELLALGVRGVPVTVGRSGEVVLGFQPDRVLALAG